MLHRSLPSTSTLPGRPVRVLVETGDPSALTLRSRPLASLDVKLCSGPVDNDETCPLVAEGTCPLGECDVVVCALGGGWRNAVHEAWLRKGVVVARAGGELAASPADQLDAYLGAALTALYRATYGTRTPP